jgi:hypothetical protein
MFSWAKIVYFLEQSKFFEDFYQKRKFSAVFFVILPPTKPVQVVGGQQWLMAVRAGRVKTNIDGIQRLRTPLVGTAKGKGRFLNVICLCSQISQI